MPRFPESAPVRVRVGACLCPDAPHADGDFVTLTTTMSIDAGVAAVQALAEAGESATDLLVTRTVLPYMISSWDFLDAETGEPIPISPDTVAEALPWNEGGREVISALGEALRGRPLASRGSPRTNSKSSPSTPTAPTPATRSSSPKRRKRSA